MRQFKLEANAIYDIKTSRKFADFISQQTLRNLTGGVMSLECTEKECIVYGTEHSSMKENILYVFDIPVINFSEEEIL